MHALGRWIQQQLDARGWTPADLARRHDDLSSQLLSKIINDPRAHLDQTPQKRTLYALAEAFGVERDVLLVVAAEAIGAPIEGVTVPPVSSATNEQLTEEILIRLRSIRPKEVPGRDQEAPASMTTDPSDSTVTELHPPRVTRAARRVRPDSESDH